MRHPAFVKGAFRRLMIGVAIIAAVVLQVAWVAALAYVSFVIVGEVF